MDRIPAYPDPNFRYLGGEADAPRLAFEPHMTQDPDGTIHTVLPARGLMFGSMNTTDSNDLMPTVRIDSFFSSMSFMYVMTAEELRALALSFNDVAQKMEDSASNMLKHALGKNGGAS